MLKPLITYQITEADEIFISPEFSLSEDGRWYIWRTDPDNKYWEGTKWDCGFPKRFQSAEEAYQEYKDKIHAETDTVVVSTH